MVLYKRRAPYKYIYTKVLLLNARSCNTASLNNFVMILSILPKPKPKVKNSKSNQK